MVGTVDAVAQGAPMMVGNVGTGYKRLGRLCTGESALSRELLEFAVSFVIEGASERPKSAIDIRRAESSSHVKESAN